MNRNFIPGVLSNVRMKNWPMTKNHSLSFPSGDLSLRRIAVVGNYQAWPPPDKELPMLPIGQTVIGAWSSNAF